MGLESLIEKEARLHLEAAGGGMVKFIGEKGLPDRACSHPFAGPWLMELKAPTKTAKKHQVSKANELAKWGWRVYLDVDTILKAKQIIDDEINGVHPLLRRHHPVGFKWV